MCKSEDIKHGSPDGECYRCSHFHGKQNVFISSIQSSKNKNKKLFKKEVENFSENQYYNETMHQSEDNSKDTEEAFEALELTDMKIKNRCKLKPDLKVEINKYESHLETDKFLTDDSSVNKKGSFLSSSKYEWKSGCHKNISLVKKTSMRNKPKTPGSAIRVNVTSTSSPSFAPYREYMPVCTSTDVAVESQPTQTIKLARGCLIGSDNYKSLLLKPIYYQNVVLNGSIIKSIYETNDLKRKLTKSASTNDLEDVKACLRKKILIPFRMTKDGTKVFFPCKISM